MNTAGAAQRVPWAAPHRPRGTPARTTATGSCSDTSTSRLLPYGPLLHASLLSALPRPPSTTSSLHAVRVPAPSLPVKGTGEQLCPGHAGQVQCRARRWHSSLPSARLSPALVTHSLSSVNENTFRQLQQNIRTAAPQTNVLLGPEGSFSSTVTSAAIPPDRETQEQSLNPPAGIYSSTHSCTAVIRMSSLEEVSPEVTQRVKTELREGQNQNGTGWVLQPPHRPRSVLV